MVAYQPGNAANMRGRGHDQPDLVAVPERADGVDGARRPALSPPTAPCSTPTPKSKPSRTKKPVHRTAMTMNQNGTSFIGPQYWTAARARRCRPLARAGGSCSREYRSISIRSTVVERAVEQRRKWSGWSRREVGVTDGEIPFLVSMMPCMIHGCLLLSVSSQPRVHQEGQHRGPDRHPQEPPGGGEFLAPDQP